MHFFILADDLLGSFGINALGFLSQLVSFGIVFFILWRWGFPVIMKTLNQRQAVIQEGIENAERAKRSLAEATANAEDLLRKARIQAQETIAQATKAADAESHRIQEEARARAEQIGKQEVARIQQEASRARAELNRLVVDLSINAAGQVIRKSVDSNDNRRLVEDFVRSSQAKEQ